MLYLPHWRHLALLVLAALSFGVIAQVANEGAAPAGASAEGGASASASAAPTPIAVPQMADRADDDERLADRVVRRLSEVDPALELGAQLDRIEASVDAMQLAYTPAQLRRLPVMRLESLERHWRFDLRRFQAWREDMQTRTQPYLDDAAALARRRAEWQLTRDQLRAHELPAVIAGRFDSVRERLAHAEDQLATLLARHLELRSRANGVEARIHQGRNAVAQAIATVDRRLLRLDSPPLWAAGAEDKTVLNVRAGLDIEARFAAEFRRASRDRVLLLNALQLALLPVLLWMSRRSRRLPAADAPPDSVRALTRPISLWILLAVMAVFAIEPDAPLLVHQVVLVIVLVPVLRLLPDRAAHWLGSWPYIVTALFLLARLGVLLLGSELLYRIFVLALGLLGLGATLWMLYRARPQSSSGRAPSWTPGRSLTFASWFSVAMLAIATVVNVAGNFSLAESLVFGVNDSAYMGLMLYVGVSVLSSLLHWGLQRPVARRLVRVPQRASSLAALLTRLLTLGAACGWVVYTMSELRILRPVYAWTSRVLSAQFELGEISISLGNVLVFVGAVFIAFWAARTVRALVHDEVLARMHISRGVGNSVASLTYYGVLLLGLLLALSAAGFKVSQLTLVFGALGVGIGFGLQGVVNNFVSGLVLMFERPIQPGDTIDVGTLSGTVSEIGLRATTVRTFDGADVVVPNGPLLAGNLINWTLRDRSRRIELTVGVSYSADPQQVIALLVATAAQTKGVVKLPEPSAFFMAFGDSALQFSLRAWTFDFDNWFIIRSDLATRVYHALAEAGIEVPFPQRDLHVRTVSPEAKGAFGGSMPSPPRGAGSDGLSEAGSAAASGPTPNPGLP